MTYKSKPAKAQDHWNKLAEDILSPFPCYNSYLSASKQLRVTGSVLQPKNSHKPQNLQNRNKYTKSLRVKKESRAAGPQSAKEVNTSRVIIEEKPSTKCIMENSRCFERSMQTKNPPSVSKILNLVLLAKNSGVKSRLYKIIYIGNNEIKEQKNTQDNQQMTEISLFRPTNFLREFPSMFQVKNSQDVQNSNNSQNNQKIHAQSFINLRSKNISSCNPKMDVEKHSFVYEALTKNHKQPTYQKSQNPIVKDKNIIKSMKELGPIRTKSVEIIRRSQQNLKSQIRVIFPELEAFIRAQERYKQHKTFYHTTQNQTDVEENNKSSKISVIAENYQNSILGQNTTRQTTSRNSHRGIMNIYGNSIYHTISNNGNTNYNTAASLNSHRSHGIYIYIYIL